ncbi:MAG: hypothetical protein V3R45_09250 [Candidatus Aminicenantaceae bacterium]
MNTTVFIVQSKLNVGIFTPRGRTDLTTTASSRPTRGGLPQLHGPMPHIGSNLGP